MRSSYHNWKELTDDLKIYNLERKISLEELKGKRKQIKSHLRFKNFLKSSNINYFGLAVAIVSYLMKKK
ncbi:MAG: hypothetical protein KDC16_11750 [Saprospiraceae bacterium]|nr:hypothetical protein [Saprospiraceae bacterium]MCB9327472.1 hypothetical protein [Lewinellaceae bacterium]HPK10156.1 hypothetical protein [Saprospiraceae bacterium]